MGMSNKVIAGYLITFEKKTSEENENKNVAIELVDNENGVVELSFEDRNEVVYVSFRLDEFLRAVMAAE